MTKFQAEWEDGYIATWRNLTWSEYKQFYPIWLNRIFKQPMDLYLEIYRLCYLDGPVAEVVPAGIVVYIAQQQLINNPFGGEFKSVSYALALARERVASNYLLSAQALIAGVFKYRLEEIDDFDPPKFFTRLAQAEVLLGPILNPGNPNQSKEQKKKGKVPDRTPEIETETTVWNR